MHEGGPRLTGVALACPIDHAPLVVSEDSSSWKCSACGRRYPVVGDVIRFMGANDSFYEGAYLNQVHFVPRSEKWHSVWPLWLINNGYVWRVRKHVPEGSVVLELGCAGGIAYFSTRYRMIGLDVSMASLQTAATHYEKCIQADASRGIPLEDGSVDAAASSFFWEHIPAGDKRVILAELRRVLRARGKIVFLYDVETDNPLVASMRRMRPALYEAEFIERDGHLGYQTPGQNKEIFESEGFRIVEHLGLERSPLQATTVWAKMRKWPQPFAAAGSVLSHMDDSRASLFSYIAVLRTIDETVGRALPDSWSRMALTVCEKVG